MRPATDLTAGALVTPIGSSSGGRPLAKGVSVLPVVESTDPRGINMLITSITTLLQESAADPGIKHLAGNIKEFEQLLDPGIVSRLEAEHGGSFSFLAFDPAGDTAIVEYLRRGKTLAADSGVRHLCLFTVHESVRGTRLVEDTAWGSAVEIESGRAIASDAVEIAFRDKPVPSLPGILLFASLTRKEDAIWVDLGACADEHAVRQRLRDVFRLANAATDYSLEKLQGTHLVSAKLGKLLQHEKIPYRRTGKYSAQEWLVRVCRFAWSHRSDVATVVPGL